MNNRRSARLSIHAYTPSLATDYLLLVAPKKACKKRLREKLTFATTTYHYHHHHKPTLPLPRSGKVTLQLPPSHNARLLAVQRATASPIRSNHLDSRQNGSLHRYARRKHSLHEVTNPPAAQRDLSPSDSFSPESGDRPERFALAEPMHRRHAGGQLQSRNRLQCRLFSPGVASGRAEPDSTHIRHPSSPPWSPVTTYAPGKSA